MPEPRDLYKVLQVDPEADADVIQATYRRLAQKYHPDLAGADDDGARMIAINAAWEVLRDPVLRAAYDRERAARLSRQASGTPGSTAPHRQQPGGGPGAGRSGQGSAGTPAATGSRPAAGATERTTLPGEGVDGSARPGESVAGNWTSGRSSVGGGYDPATMRSVEGFGGAGKPPGGSAGSVLNFGRYAGWSLGEVARTDLEYLEWLERSPIGRQYAAEIDGFLRRAGKRGTAGDENDRRGLFRRR